MEQQVTTKLTKTIFQHARLSICLVKLWERIPSSVYYTREKTIEISSTFNVFFAKFYEFFNW
jgi:hypothetical protein